MLKNIDKTDQNILKYLQKDATMSLEAIAEQVGVSLNTCWRRVQALEKSGIIRGRVALLDQDKVGLPMRPGRYRKSWSFTVWPGMWTTF